jgi:hypothetical protein
MWSVLCTVIDNPIENDYIKIILLKIILFGQLTRLKRCGSLSWQYSHLETFLKALGITISRASFFCTITCSKFVSWSWTVQNLYPGPEVFRICILTLNFNFRKLYICLSKLSSQFNSGNYLITIKTVHFMENLNILTVLHKYFWQFI